jgi:hypothetical protein
VFYDELAYDPVAGLGELCHFLEMPFEPEALSYWTKSHHAFAANGASSALLSRLPHAATMRFFVTGDDDYYRMQRERHFLDDRWKAALTEAEQRLIRGDGEVQDLLAIHGRVLTVSSIRKQRFAKYRRGIRNLFARPFSNASSIINREGDN